MTVTSIRRLGAPQTVDTDLLLLFPCSFRAANSWIYTYFFGPFSFFPLFLAR